VEKRSSFPGVAILYRANLGYGRRTPEHNRPPEPPRLMENR